MRTTTTGLDLQILDRHSSVPIASAVVNIVWDQSHLVTEHVDVHGVVSVDLPEGAYDIMVTADGYVATLFRGVGVLEGQRVELIRGLGRGEGRLEETPAGAIGGLCIDRLDHPMTNIIVQATAADEHFTVRSDKRGCYVLNGLPPATYTVNWRSGDRALMTHELKVERPRQLIRQDVRLLYA